VAFAAGDAAETAARVEIICCVGEVTMPEVAPRTLREAAKAVVPAARSRVQEAHPRLRVTTSVVENLAERVLVDASLHAGLVVVGSRGRGAFRSMVAGSTACAVIHDAACPVAVVGDGQI
jgi:nucleotide-binding universal stress UspA family protein